MSGTFKELTKVLHTGTYAGLTVGHFHPPPLLLVLVLGGAAVKTVQVLEENHLLLEAAAAEHALRSTAVADIGAVGQTGADAAQPAELVQTGRGPSAGQLDGGRGVLTDKTLRRNHNNHLQKMDMEFTSSIFLARTLIQRFFCCDMRIGVETSGLSRLETPCYTIFIHST